MLFLVQGCQSESAPPATAGPQGSWVVATEPSRVLGVLDGDPAYQFSDVSAAALAPDGRLVVADAGSATVRTYDPDGRLLRLLGGEGSGPGEFVRPSQVLIRDDGSVLVWDDATFRVTEFDPTGELAGVATFSREDIGKAVEPPLYPASGLLLSNGDLIVRLIFKTSDLPAGRFRPQAGALRVAADQSAIDTILFFRDTEQVSVRLPKGSFPVAPPLARRTTIAIQPNEARLCIGEQAKPEILCFAPEGQRVVVRWEAERIPVRLDDPAPRSWRDSMTQLYAQKMTTEAADRILSQVAAPAEYPSYTDHVLDRAGYLWVKTPAVDGYDEVDRYLVFTPAGQRIGPVSVPPVRILEIGDDYLVGVDRDEFEVQYIKLFRVARPGSG